MTQSHTFRTSRRKANLGCESLEKREVLSTTSLSTGLTHAWAGHDWSASGGKGNGAQTAHFDHAKAGSSATVSAASTTDTTTSSSSTGFTGFGPGGPGGPGGPNGKAPTLPAAVQAAQTQLQTDMKSFQTSPPTKASAASLAQLQTDLKAAQAGTLTNATATLQADQNAILSSQGLTSTQISTIDSDQAAMKAAFPNAPAPPGGGIMIGVAFPGGPGGGSGGPGGPGGQSDANLPTSVKTVLTQLQTDTKAAIGNPPKALPAASLAQLKTDMAAIKGGTLTGTAGSTAIQNDKNAILSSQGATAAQIATINSDQTAVQAAFKAAFPNAPATPTGTGGGGFGFNPGGPMIP